SGACDNAKKMFEVEPRTADTGSSSEKYNASVTCDTDGNPLKANAGLSVKTLLKVMNMVAVLAVPLMIAYDKSVVETVTSAAAAANFELVRPLTYVSWDALRVIAIVVSVALVGWAIWQSKRPSKQAEAAAGEL